MTALRGLAAMLTLAAMTIGLPVALYDFGGSPVPARLPSLHRMSFVLLHRGDSGGLFIGAIREVSWLAWAAFTVAVLAEAQATLRERRAPRLYLAGLQGAAGRLVALAALTFTTPAMVALATSSALAATTQPAAPQGGQEPTAHSSPAADTVTAEHVIVVHPGDCLWTIAQHYLGAGDRYGEIVRLNIGHDMGDGEVFTDPSMIQPGWHLRLPESAAAPSQAGSPAGGQHGGSQHDGARRNVTGSHNGHPSADARFDRPHSAANRPAAGAPGAAGHPGQPGQPGHAGSGAPQAAGSGARPGQSSGQQDQAVDVVLFTLGMVAGGALVSLERLRHRQRQYRRSGRRIALPTDAAGRRLEQKLRAAASRGPLAVLTWREQLDAEPELSGEPGLYGLPDPFGPDESSDQPDSLPLVPGTPASQPTSLREALRDLSEGIAARGGPLPPIVGIHLSADSLDVLLSAPAAGPPPAPFVIAPARRAMCWTVALHGGQPDAAAVPPAPGEVGDLLPGLFTAGATESGGYLLLDLEAMRVTCCDSPGDLADRLLVTAATELASSRWSGWYDLVLAGCAELDVLGRAQLCADLDSALDVLAARAETVAGRIGDGGPQDVRARRLADPEDEDWGLTLLVSRIRPTPAQMSRLLELADGPGGVAALVAGDTQAADGKLAPAVFDLALDPSNSGGVIATITLAHLGAQHQITVWPQTLTVSEYEALGGMFATAAQTRDVAPESPPYDDYGAPPWIRLAAAPVALAQADEDEEFARPVSYPEPGEPANDPDADELVDPDPGSRPQNPAHERAAGVWRHQGTGPRHAAPSLEVKVVGPVEIVGSAEPLAAKQAELMLALALHAPVGLSNSALCNLLGADADHPRPADSVRQLITRTRRRLGLARDGQEHILHLGSGIYVLHDDVRLDWASFGALARRGRADLSREDLRAAMALVRGQPFADCYHWWIDIGLIETIRAEIVDAADLLAQLELAAGDPRGAARAARAGLAAETAAEQLWRALMWAEHNAGNPAGVHSAWTGCLDAIAEIAPGGEPHPDTERLFRQLTRGAMPVGVRR